jgi:hypothetical protein
MIFSKSLFASKTFWVNLLAGFIGVAGEASGLIPPKWAPYIAAAVGVANILLRLISTGPVHVTTPQTVTQASPDAPQVKAAQAGYARLGVLAILLMAGCASLGFQSSQTIDQSLQEAESVATAALSASTSLLVNKSIDLPTDKKVRKSHDVVISAVTMARGMESAGNAAGAAAQLAAIQGDLSFLKTIH